MIVSSKLLKFLRDENLMEFLTQVVSRATIERANQILGRPALPQAVRNDLDTLIQIAESRQRAVV